MSAASSSLQQPKSRAPPKRVVPSAVAAGSTAASAGQSHLFNVPVQPHPHPHAQSVWTTPAAAPAAAAAAHSLASRTGNSGRAWAAMPTPTAGAAIVAATPLLHNASAWPVPSAATTAAAASAPLAAAAPVVSVGSTPVAGSANVSVPATALPAAVVISSTSARYDSVSDAGNFFSEQDLLGTDHADYLFGRAAHAIQHGHSHSLSSSPQQTQLLLGSADVSDPIVLSSPGDGGGSSSASLQMQGLGGKGDFKARIEVALYNDRERMRDGFMDLLRRFTERRARNNGLGGAGQHLHTSAGSGLASNASASSAFIAPSELIRPLVRDFMQRCHPANFGWFALEIYTSLLVARCWSGVEDGVDAQRRRHAHGQVHARNLSAAVPSPLGGVGTLSQTHAQGATPVASLDHSARAYAHLAQLKARLDAPAASSVNGVTGERKQSIGGGYISSAHSSAAPSPVSASSARQGLLARGMATPTSSSRSMGHNAWPRPQQQLSQQLQQQFAPLSSTNTFSSAPSAAAAVAPSPFPPHLSFSFGSSGSATPPELHSLFPELQEFFAAFLLEADSHRLVVCVRNALLLKMHQLCDVGASAPGASGSRQGGGGGGGGVPIGFSHASAESLRRTWHGRVLKLKLLAKFLAFVSVLPHADLARLAEAGGGNGGVGAAGAVAPEQELVPSHAIGLVAAASAAAMDKLTFPPFVRLHTHAAASAAAAVASAGPLSLFASSASLVPSFSFPLHLYLSYALHTHSLSLFLPWLCAYLRVLRLDPVQLGTEYVRMLLQEMARISVELKRRLRRAAIAEQLRRHHRDKAAAAASGGLARTFSSPLHSASGTLPLPRTCPTSGGGGSTLSPVLTPLTTPGASPYPSPPPSGSGLGFVRNRGAESEVDTEAVTPPLSPRQLGLDAPLAARPSTAAGGMTGPSAAHTDSSCLSPFARSSTGGVYSAGGGVFSSPSASSSLGVPSALFASMSPAGSLSAFGGSPLPASGLSTVAATPSPFSGTFVASPSPSAQGTGNVTSSGSSAGMMQHSSLLFLLLELRDLFEWLELDVDTLSDEWERRSRSPAGVLLDPLSLFALTHQHTHTRLHASPSPSSMQLQQQQQPLAAPLPSESTAVAAADTALGSSASSASRQSSAAACAGAGAGAAANGPGPNGRAPSTAKKSLMARFTQSALSHPPAAASTPAVSASSTALAPTSALAAAVSVAAGTTASVTAPVRSASMAATTVAPASGVTASSSAAAATLVSDLSAHGRTSLSVGAGAVVLPPRPASFSYSSLDSIPSLVSESLIPSLLGKTLEQIRATLRRHAVEVPQSSAAIASGGAGAGGLLSSPGAAAGSLVSADASMASGALARSVSAISRENRRKITPVTAHSGAANAAGSLPGIGSSAAAAAGAAATSSSPPAPSPSALLDQLRPAFFQSNPELSSLLATISAPLERHVRAEGAAITEPLSRRIDEALAVLGKQVDAEMRQIEANGDASNAGAEGPSAASATPLQRLEQLLSAASESALAADLYQSCLADCTASVTAYLCDRSLAALRALSSPSTAAGVLVTASLLGAKRSLHALRDSIEARLRKTIDERVRVAIKKAKVALARITAQQQTNSQSRLSGAVSPASGQLLSVEVQSEVGIAAPAAVAVSAPDSAQPLQQVSRLAAIPSPLASAPLIDSVVSREIAIRVSNARRCVSQLQSTLRATEADQRLQARSPSSPSPWVAGACKSLLRALLSLSICVTASQSTPLLAQQASFAPFATAAEDEAEATGSDRRATAAPLIAAACQLLQRMEMTATTATTKEPAAAAAARYVLPPVHELSQCWLHLSQLDRAIAAASPQHHAASWSSANGDATKSLRALLAARAAVATATAQ